jgi:hypothetical protein
MAHAPPFGAMFQVKYMVLLSTSIRRERHENVMSSVMRRSQNVPGRKQKPFANAVKRALH